MENLKISNINDKEKGYILGLLAGDGYLFHDKKSRHYHIEFYLNSIKDKAIRDLIEEIIKKLELTPQKYFDKRFNCVRIRTYSKELYEYITKRSYNENFDFKIGFVSGFIDSDGYYNKKKSTLVIINTNLEKIKLANLYLKDLGINSSINKKFMSKKYKNQPYNLYISVKFKSLKHLSQKVSIAG